MKYSSQGLAKALFSLTKENPADYQKVIDNFIVFCKEKHLSYLLPSLLKYFEIETKRENDVKTFKIFSSVKLGADTIKKIQQSAQAESSLFVEEIEDKSIIAGFIARYQNKIIDASLKNNLQLLKNKLYEY